MTYYLGFEKPAAGVIAGLSFILGAGVNIKAKQTESWAEVQNLFVTTDFLASQLSQHHTAYTIASNANELGEFKAISGNN